MTDERITPEIEEADFITLEFDDGAEVECEIMGVFDYEGKEYIALIPNDGSDDVYIYGYKEVGEEEFELVDIESDEEFEKVVVPLIPMGKLIQPEDIAETILFLASEKAGMLTGQVIKVSGGHAL